MNLNSKQSALTGMNHITCLLVVDIVKCVACIPGNNQANLTLQIYMSGRDIYSYLHGDPLQLHQNKDYDDHHVERSIQLAL